MCFTAPLTQEDVMLCIPTCYGSGWNIKGIRPILKFISCKLPFLYFINFFAGARNGLQCREPPMCCYSCYPCHQWTLKYISHQSLIFSTFNLICLSGMSITQQNLRLVFNLDNIMITPDICCWFCHVENLELITKLIHIREGGERWEDKDGYP